MGVHVILLLGGEKGGSGKSCLAQNLAVWLQLKRGDVLLLDVKPGRLIENGGPLKMKNCLRPRKLGLRQFFIFEGLTIYRR
jgi:cellulose biosynthesis protein BcsQ